MKITLIILLALTLPMTSNSIEPIDGYYSNDLLGAVDEAKERAHHYDYSNNYRYKRTTAQSIQLNPINLNDLEDTNLSMLKKSDIKKGEVIDINRSKIEDNKFNLLGSHSSSLEITPSLISKNTSRSISLTGELSSSGIINNTTLKSTPRP